MKMALVGLVGLSVVLVLSVLGTIQITKAMGSLHGIDGDYL